MDLRHVLPTGQIYARHGVLSIATRYVAGINVRDGKTGGEKRPRRGGVFPCGPARRYLSLVASIAAFAPKPTVTGNEM
jgi:hypothetical protein